MCTFWVFNICFLLKGVSDIDSLKWTLTVEFFEVVSWITCLVFVALNAGLFYFGEYVETSHEAFILLLFWVNGFVGPFVMLSFGFLGLLHFMNNDVNSNLNKLLKNGQLAVIASLVQAPQAYQPVFTTYRV